MECAAGCGVSKVQHYRISRDGRMMRDGTARYHYPEAGYRFGPREPGSLIDRDALRFSLLSRLFPELQW